MSLRQKIILVSVLVLGVIAQITPVFKSGLDYSFGIGYWGANGHDSIWHLSLINGISNPLKISLPIFSGEILKNYHPFFDILIHYLSAFTHISSSFLLFQIFPLISSIIFLYLCFALGQLLTSSFAGGIFFVLLNVFANSFGWLVSIFRFDNFSGESLFWAMQSPSNQTNPPYQLSLIFLLLLFIILIKHPLNSKFSPLENIVVFVILALLPVTKVYSAVVGFSFFGLFAFRSLYLNHKFDHLILFFVSLFSGYYFYSRFNPLSSGLIKFQPFWFINSMIESPDRFYLPFLANIRYSLEASGKFELKLIAVYLIGISIFFVGNYSWRLLAIFKTKNFDLFHLCIYLNILFLSLIPIFFIQNGTPWNTIQFLYYALFLANILFVEYLVQIINSKFGIAFIALVFSSYLLAFFGTLPNYTGKVPPAFLPNSEVSALNFLSKQPSGTVLTVPYDNFLKDHFKSAPIPLYAYETTGYVSAYSFHPTYLEDEMNLKNSGYDVNSRRNPSSSFFEQKNINQDRGFLVNNQISYIYLAGLQTNLYHLSDKNLFLTKIFENDGAVIYRVQR